MVLAFEGLLYFFLQMVEDPLQLLRIKCVAEEQGDGVLGKLSVLKRAHSIKHQVECDKN